MKLLGNIGQWLSVCLMFVGIYYLISFNIDRGTILFSIGCLIDVLATKVKYYGDEIIKKNKELRDALKYEKEIYLYNEENTAVGGKK